MSLNNAEKSRLVLLQNPRAFHKASEALTCILLLNHLRVVFLRFLSKSAIAFHFISHLNLRIAHKHNIYDSSLCNGLKSSYFRADYEPDACKLFIFSLSMYNFIFLTYGTYAISLSISEI